MKNSLYSIVCVQSADGKVTKEEFLTAILNSKEFSEMLALKVKLAIKSEQKSIYILHFTFSLLFWNKLTCSGLCKSIKILQ